ncbi:MAG: hypothetical protein VKL39_23475 [Leptolyngbyaceae bacterium]|nr:hypothetical protein [Leptolyngbyaceae bacterium]
MQITLAEFNDEAFCPICSNKDRIDYKDYVEYHPMFFCWNCHEYGIDEHRESKFVLACSIEDLEKYEPNQKVDLLLIKRIANSESIDKFVEEFNKKRIRVASFDVLCEYGIGGIQKYLNISDDEMYKLVLDKVGVELNSYNMVDIHKKYPEYSLDHDGCYILIEVLEKDGTLTRMMLSGD